MKKLIITQYTDPMCIWCYGFEPSLRKIDFLNPGKVEFRNVMGILVGDVKEIIGEGQFAAIRFAQLKNQMTEHFKDTARRSGMPVSTEHMKNKQPEEVTSLMMSLAFEAMKQFGEDTANRYLRRIREAAHADDMPATKAATLISLAEEFGISQEEFAKAMNSDAAKKALEQDNAICRAAGVHSFPTMKLEYGGKSLMLNGWMPYKRFAAAVRQLCGDEIVTANEPMTAESLATFVSQYKKVAAEEIKTAFSLSDSVLDEAVDMLISSGLYQKMERGSSYFVADTASLVCDSVTGTCRVQQV